MNCLLTGLLLTNSHLLLLIIQTFKNSCHLFNLNINYHQGTLYNIRSFSQCVTDDGCALLPHAIIMAKHSTATNSIRVPAWYKFLKAITITSPTSYGSFAIEKEETQKKIKFMFICQI